MPEVMIYLCLKSLFCVYVSNSNSVCVFEELTRVIACVILREIVPLLKYVIHASTDTHTHFWRYEEKIGREKNPGAARHAKTTDPNFLEKRKEPRIKKKSQDRKRGATDGKVMEVSVEINTKMKTKQK